jgi:hypothetical protein
VSQNASPDELTPDLAGLARKISELRIAGPSLAASNRMQVRFEAFLAGGPTPRWPGRFLLFFTAALAIGAAGAAAAAPGLPSDLLRDSGRVVRDVFDRQEVPPPTPSPTPSLTPIAPPVTEPTAMPPAPAAGPVGDDDDDDIAEDSIPPSGPASPDDDYDEAVGGNDDEGGD